MLFNLSDLNKNKLTHLLADDMFAGELKQVFNAKTGKHIGYIYEGKEIITDEEPEPEFLQPDEKPNPSQLSLF